MPKKEVKEMKPDAKFLERPKRAFEVGDKAPTLDEINGFPKGTMVEVTEVKHDGRMFRVVFPGEAKKDGLVFAPQLGPEVQRGWTIDDKGKRPKIVKV